MHSFHFRYPKEWRVKMEKDNIVHVLSNDGTDCRLNLYSSKNKVSLESELLRSINEFKVPITNYKTVKQTPCKVAGCDAIAIECEFVSNDNKLNAIQYVVHVGETSTIIITAIYNVQDFKADEYMIKGVINSLKIIAKKDSFNIGL